MCQNSFHTPTHVSHREAGSFPLEGHLGAQEPIPPLQASSQAPTDEAITAWGNGKGYQEEKKTFLLDFVLFI